jgi:hypothetical protein
LELIAGQQQNSSTIEIHTTHTHQQTTERARPGRWIAPRCCTSRRAKMGCSVSLFRQRLPVPPSVHATGPPHKPLLFITKKTYRQLIAPPSFTLSLSSFTQCYSCLRSITCLRAKCLLFNTFAPDSNRSNASAQTTASKHQSDDCRCISRPRPIEHHCPLMDVHTVILPRASRHSHTQGTRAAGRHFVVAGHTRHPGTGNKQQRTRVIQQSRTTNTTHSKRGAAKVFPIPPRSNHSHTYNHTTTQHNCSHTNTNNDEQSRSAS